MTIKRMISTRDLKSDPMPVPAWLRDATITPLYNDQEIVAALKKQSFHIGKTAEALRSSRDQVLKVARRNAMYFPEKQNGRRGRPPRRVVTIDLEEVAKRRAAGETMTAIARSMGVSSEVIYSRLRDAK